MAKEQGPSGTMQNVPNIQPGIGDTRGVGDIKTRQSASTMLVLGDAAFDNPLQVTQELRERNTLRANYFVNRLCYCPNDAKNLVKSMALSGVSGMVLVRGIDVDGHRELVPLGEESPHIDGNVTSVNNKIDPLLPVEDIKHSPEKEHVDLAFIVEALIDDQGKRGMKIRQTVLHSKPGKNGPIVTSRQIFQGEFEDCLAYRSEHRTFDLGALPIRRLP